MEEKVIFLSNEILVEDLPNYAGGLGILSGGILSSARDMNYPMIGISFLYKKGYTKHEIKGGEVLCLEDAFDPNKYFSKINKKFFVELKDLKIYFQIWEYKMNEKVNIFYIDTDVEENEEKLRKLTERVYIEENEEEKILKRLLLGLGALKIIEGFEIPVKKFHLNESHCAFLAIELLKKFGNTDEVRKRVVFTSHTPLPHGHEKFDYNLVEKFYEIPESIKEISPKILHMSKVLFFLSGFRNGVSWKHHFLLKRDFPEYEFDYVTNGVHTKWVAEPLRIIYDKYIKGWFLNPEKFSFAGTINLKELEEGKKKAKKELIEIVKEEGYFNKEFKEKDIIISLRRRITGYKRVDLLFYNIEELEKLGKTHNIQILISGVSHPKNYEGLGIIKKLYDLFSTLKNVKLALVLRNGKKYERCAVSGCDLFIHCPLPPFEACGTSWMRAALNASPTLASRDGGVLEVLEDGYNGWLFGCNYFEICNTQNSEIDEFYFKLRNALELYKNQKEEFLKICRNTLKTIPPLFNTKRVLKEYIAKAYI